MIRTVVLDKNLGGFCGTVGGYAVFTKNDPIGISSLFGFDSEEIARKYFQNKNIKDILSVDAVFLTLETKAKFVTCIDVIRAGYGDYVKEMINLMPMPSEAIH